VLVHRGQKLAVIEAKRRDLPDTEGGRQSGQTICRDAADSLYLFDERRRYLSDRHGNRERGLYR
jgi:hypothetical protein